MFQIDNDTSSQNMPAPSAPGTPGYFVDGDPAKGIPATILPAEFMNMLMMEFINLVKSAGLKPSKADYTQLQQALPLLISKLATVDWSKVTNIPADLVHTNTAPNFIALELFGQTPYIDFHYNSDASDYNIRLCNNGDGTLSVFNKAGTPLWAVNSGAFDVAVPVLARKGATLISQGGGMSLSMTSADNTLARFALNHTDTTFNLCTFNDAGAFLAAVIAVARATGKVTLNGPLEVAGAALLDTTLEVKGAAVMDSTLEVKGATILDTTLEVKSATVLDSSLEVKGLATMDGNLNVKGSAAVTGAVTAGTNVAAAVSVYAALASLTSNVLRLQCSDASNAGNVHLWMYNNDGSERALIYADNTGGLHFRSVGAADTLVLAANGAATFKSTVTAGGRVQGSDLLGSGNVYSGGGNAFLGTDGNVNGSVWGGYLSNYLSANYVGRTNLGNDIAVYASGTGGVGTYAYMRNNGTTNIAPGQLIAGSSLAYADSDENNTGTATGTWRAMGYGTAANCSMYLRVS